MAADLLALADPPAEESNIELLAAGLERLFPSETDRTARGWPRRSAVLRRFAVIAGGPGTGKTTTVARILALLAEQAASSWAPAAADRAGGADRQGGRAPGGGGARGGGQAARRHGHAGAPRRSAARRCTACSAGDPANHSRFRHDR